VVLSSMEPVTAATDENGKLVEQKHEQMRAGHIPFRTDEHRVVQFFDMCRLQNICRTLSKLVTQQARLQCHEFSIGDHIVFRTKRYRQHNKIGKTKVGLREGYLCRIPPPGGVGTFVQDMLCNSYVVRVTGYHHRTFSNACPSVGEFVELHSSKLIVGLSHGEVAGAGRRRTGKLSRRLVQNLQHAVRFTHNPISTALACTFACTDSRVRREAGTSLMKAELKQIAAQYASVAHNLVSHVDPAVRGAVLLPQSRLELRAFPKHAQAQSALELSLTHLHSSFTNHPVCEDFVGNLWTGALDDMKSGLHLPDTDDLWNLGKMFTSITKNVTLLNSMSFVLSPITRFVTEFSLLVALVAVHHLVVFDGPWSSVDFVDSKPTTKYAVTTGALTTTESVFIVMATGHLFAEVEELYEAVRGARLRKYFMDGWNVLDWAVHFVVIAYLYFRLVGIENSSASECQHAIRVLSLNCILLWLRLVNVMTISPQLGPLVHMIALMAKDVANFLVLLFMCKCYLAQVPKISRLCNRVARSAALRPCN